MANFKYVETITTSQDVLTKLKRKLQGLRVSHLNPLQASLRNKICGKYFTKKRTVVTVFRNLFFAGS